MIKCCQKDVGIKKLIQKALKIRDFEKRILDDPTMPGSFHTCLGQEWTAVCVINALIPGDVIFSNHRGHGHFLAWTEDFNGLLAELQGKLENGVCHGIGGSQHLHADGFYSNGIQGGMVPIAAGTAMAMKREERDNVAVVFIGDGTLGQGVVYETIHIAVAWGLPLVIVIESNEWAMYTKQDEFSIETWERFGKITNLRLNTYSKDCEMWPKWIEEDINFCRPKKKQKPCIIEIQTPRLGPHSRGKEIRSDEKLKCLWEEDWLENQRRNQG